MKIIAKAKYFKSGQTVLDRGTRFIIDEIRVRTSDGAIVFIDVEGGRHGGYHPDEYLGMEESPGRRYAVTCDWQKVEEAYLLANMSSETIH